MIFIFKRKNTGLSIEVEASSKKEAIDIFLKRYPETPIARLGLDDNNFNILGWSVIEKT